MSTFTPFLTNLNKISNSDALICDSPITSQEVADAINHLKCNKSPGSDGITAEFYKHFSDPLTPFLFEVYKESLTNMSLPPSMTQGVISLIPKPHKDMLQIDNWRPISLLNNDYKILASLLAVRFKKVLNKIIDENQSGFMKNRCISNNIRLILDLIDYSELTSDKSFILFLDFFKAFDTVEHPFLFYCPEKLGFGGYMCNAIKTLYTHGNSSVK